jgi:hypothetical protein
MGRIRTIKPEFPLSETTGALKRESRLLFLQLFTIVDDEGRTRGASRMLASLLYPYDNDAAELMPVWLSDLEKHGAVRTYTVEGATYLEITNWLKHQKIDHPSKSRLPAYSDALAKSREASRSLAPDLGPSILDQVPTDQGPSSAVANATAALLIGNLFEQFWKAYPKREGANPKEPARKKFQWAISNGATADEIIEGAKAYASEIGRTGKANSGFVARALTWLTESRWKDYQPKDADLDAQAETDANMRRLGYVWIEPAGWTKAEGAKADAA